MTMAAPAASEEPQPLRVGVGLNMWSLDFLVGHHHELDRIVCGRALLQPIARRPRATY